MVKIKLKLIVKKAAAPQTEADANKLWDARVKK